MLKLMIMLAGFFPLIWGAEMLVNGASSLAKRLNIPNIVIGLTIVAFGTSAPELVVNLFSSLAGSSPLALGNVIGSNIFNILAILGISAIIYPLTVKSNTTWFEIPLALLSALLVFIVANDALLTGKSISQIDRIDGLVLLCFFLIFLGYNIQLMKSGEFNEEVSVKDYPPLKLTFLILGGLAMLIIGGRLIVAYASEVARSICLSERIIALTIVSAGTSLPELATSAVAARQRNVDIAIGNIVGSNIFNAFFILGLSAVINPVKLEAQSNFDLLINIGSSLLLFIFIFIGRGRKVERLEGALFIALYMTYLYFLILH